ncbi:hypothetical protein Dform_01806 [Dehalogenimonas formicexedens]|uniref:YDG domain-containing protein n=1 Tax=Dehalogenimonas formicexedens TaxID=1839801 RepID=A0A1P8F9K8_9CHLR|nr:YDG domain-containing protein [Dehalogenimonas formicexedens]APV45125.1 hypothetical protein Dform_01806 [Dehalogenimonas formicexedens]
MLTLQRVMIAFALALISFASFLPESAIAVPFDQTPESVSITNGAQDETYVVDSCIVKNGPNDYEMWYTHIKTTLDLFGILDGLKPLITQELINNLTGVNLLGLMADLAGVASGPEYDALWSVIGNSTPVVGYATSTDGKSWNVVNDEVFSLGSGLWNLPAAPRIIKNSSTSYQMWYSHAKTNLTKVALQNLLLDLNNSATRKSAIMTLLDGTSNVVGYATSTDGRVWTNVADDIVAPNGTGIWASAIAGSVIKNGASDYQMWFSLAATAMTEANLDAILAVPAAFDFSDLKQIANDISTVIGYATSSDGQTWSVVNPSVLSGGVGLWNSVASPRVIKVGSKYKMWFTKLETNLTSDNLQTIFDAVTALKPELVNLWTVYNTGDFTAFVNAIEDFLANKITDLRTVLSNTSTVIAYATSTDGQNWQEATDPTLSGPNTSPWGSVGVSSVVLNAGVYEMWYIRGSNILDAQFLVDVLQGTFNPLTYERSTSKTLTVSGITASNKVYDGNNSAIINTSGAILTGFDTGDDVVLNFTAANGTFADKNVEAGKMVTISGISLSGADASFYVVSQPTTAADIAPASLVPTVTVADKVYDGNTSATILTRTLTGVKGNDSVTLTGGTATFDTAAIGTGKTVTVIGLTVGGADAGNYTLSSTSATTTANITQATGGGGGGGGGFGSQLVGIGLSGTSPFMDGNGRAITAGLIRTPDGSLSLSVPIGTYIWNAAGAAQSFLSAAPLADPPAPPAQNSLILAFEMGPTGVTFNPAISMTISYTDGQVPAGTNEADLYIAWWDGAKWAKLTGTVNAAANTVTVSVSHFTIFALLAPAAPPPPPAPTLKINSPAAGASFDPGSVSLSIAVGNLKLVHGDNLPKVPGEGRIIYYLDVTIPIAAGQSALSAVGTFTESIATSNAWANLAPGTHTLGVQLVQNDHTPFNPPVFANVSVTIKESPPQTSGAPIQTTPPNSDKPDFSWLLIVTGVLSALALGVFLFWKSRKPADKLEYTNRK